MDFSTDIGTLMRGGSFSFQLVGAKLPSAKDVFFRAKQRELIDQYTAARLFLNETETDDWNHWFEQMEDEETKLLKLIYRARFYETALLYYNIVVDFSWTLCYVSAEYACSFKDERVNIDGIIPIEEAISLLRIAEKNVSSPDADGNPFIYLKKMCPEFDEPINLVIEFWKEFGSSNIRQLYNFCKHRGHPSYNEIEALSSGRIMGFYMKDKNDGTVTQLVSDVSDVSYSLSLEDAIVELHKFDDEKLFPYIEDLLNKLERILQPSPMIT
jgi:hypothetical protein